MKCRDVQDLLPACLEEGLLSPREEEEIRRHLLTCSACGESLADLRKSRELLGALEEVDPPAGFRERILDRIGKVPEKKKPPWQTLFHLHPLKIPLQALATVLVAVLVLSVFRGMEGDGTGRGIPRAPLEEKVKDAAPEPLSEVSVKTQPPPEFEEDRGAGTLQSAPPAGITGKAGQSGTAPPGRFPESRTLREKSDTFSGPEKKRPSPERSESQEEMIVGGLSGVRPVTLLVRDGQKARREVETLLGRLGIPCDRAPAVDGKTILTLKTDARFLRKLTEELKKIGTIGEGEAGWTDNGPVAITLVIIESPSP